MTGLLTFKEINELLEIEHPQNLDNIVLNFCSNSEYFLRNKGYIIDYDLENCSITYVLIIKKDSFNKTYKALSLMNCYIECLNDFINNKL